MDALIKTSDGDLRRAITYLQSASRLHSASETQITAVSIQEIGGVVPDHVLENLSKSLNVGNDEMEVDGIEILSGFDRVRIQVEKIVRDGYSATQILSQVCFSLAHPNDRCLTFLYSYMMS